MVLQLAVTAHQLSKFYGAVVEEAKDKQESGTKTWNSRALFQDAKMVFIEHENTVYRLMITKQGKLILNK